MADDLVGRRILHVVGGSSYGGGSKVILDLAQGSISRGAHVDVLTTNEQMAAEAREIGAGVVGLDAIRRSIHPVGDGLGLLRLIRFLRQARYDVVHTHTSKAGVLGRLAAFAARVPVIVHTVHGFAFHDGSPAWIKAAVITVERGCAALSDKVVTVSHHHADVSRSLRIVPERKIVAIPNGVRKPEAPNLEAVGEIRRELAPNGERLWLCHGRLAEQKGIALLIQALGRLRELDALPDDLRVCIAGDGPLRHALEAEAGTRGVAEHVKFLGFRTDITTLIDAADLVVLPSLWEGLSIALLEAMSRGADIAASDIPSNRELIQDGRNALLFPAADPEALAMLLRRVVSGEVNVGAMGRQAQIDILSSHTLAGMQDAYNDLYARRLSKSMR